MSEVTLSELRDLRKRADDLLGFTISDLQPFLHKKDNETFRRTPLSESIEGDVNVTTSCSCLMALALTDSFKDFYKFPPAEKKDVAGKVKSTFSRVIKAPWMSSGLTANNAFSTTLVIRTFGFLKQEKLLDEAAIPKKSWELNLGISEEIVIEFCSHIEKRNDALARFLFSALSDETRRLIAAAVPNEKPALDKRKKGLLALLSLDLRRLIQSGEIFTKERFPKVSSELKDETPKWRTNYELACINQKLLTLELPQYFPQSSDLSLPEIAALMLSDPDNFVINKYSASATLLYWFIDGVTRANMRLNPDDLGQLCRWATHQFNRERSLVLAGHAAMMDPVAMAMAACLCAKLRRLTEDPELGTEKSHREVLPSVTELEHSIQELFKRQTRGIWPKYFPLFHYQEAGSNFCFTFELLEAVLCEFGRSDNTLLDQRSFLDGLENAVAWCEANRLNYSHDETPYNGWNSGGDIQTLKKELPESWATAVVHMFLWELKDVLSQRIQKRILQKYGARLPQLPVEKFKQEMRKNSTWKDRNFGAHLRKLQDIEIYFNRDYAPLTSILSSGMLERNFGRTEHVVRREKVRKPLSALLFGPPGTSKTQVTKAIANDLGWPFIEINPSEFVKGSFANVYLQAEEIFKDLEDLAAVVVLFDEMDALTQNRAVENGGNRHLDTATQFLITSMLPKLSSLHDKGGVIFFMATNFQDRFDEAIKRAGRFDLLICMGPPMLKEMLSKMEIFFDFALDDNQKKKAVGLIESFLIDAKTEGQMLELFTFGDFKSFIKQIAKERDDIGDALEHLGKEGFLKAIRRQSEVINLKFSDFQKFKAGELSLRSIDQMEADHFQSCVDKIKETSLGQFLRDRRESRSQY